MSQADSVPTTPDELALTRKGERYPARQRNPAYVQHLDALGDPDRLIRFGRFFDAAGGACARDHLTGLMGGQQP